ncbi:UNVERIFIED_CONTAM: hypothetical protein FKN15_027522 [Acipenser sinensis]
MVKLSDDLNGMRKALQYLALRIPQTSSLQVQTQLPGRGHGSHDPGPRSREVTGVRQASEQALTQDPGHFLSFSPSFLLREEVLQMRRETQHLQQAKDRKNCT